MYVVCGSIRGFRHPQRDGPWNTSPVDGKGGPLLHLLFGFHPYLGPSSDVINILKTGIFASFFRVFAIAWHLLYDLG